MLTGYSRRDRENSDAFYWTAGGPACPCAFRRELLFAAVPLKEGRRLRNSQIADANFEQKPLSRNLSREFCEILNIVLDRSQFNRIISHTLASKSCWMSLKDPLGAVRGCVGLVVIWHYLSASAPPE